jgi:hypothetical protein
VRLAIVDAPASRVRRNVFDVEARPLLQSDA